MHGLSFLKLLEEIMSSLCFVNEYILQHPLLQDLRFSEYPNLSLSLDSSLRCHTVCS